MENPEVVLKNGYYLTSLDDAIHVEKIVTIHYFEYSKDFIFEGEEHDFWEFVYVDKGEVEIIAGTMGYRLKQNEIVFHKPGEFHRIWADGTIAPNVIVVSFECNSKSMEFFNNKIMSLGKKSRTLLTNIISEGFEAFEGPFDDPYTKKLVKRKDAKFGSQQMLRLNLEALLIQLIRDNEVVDKSTRIQTTIKERSDINLTNKILDFLNENIYKNLTLDEICSNFMISKTYLLNIFKEVTGNSIMKHFSLLKIEEAKRLIREDTHNISEIAEMLGFSSVHYFSRLFKKITKMTPTEYAATVKAKAGL